MSQVAIEIKERKDSEKSRRLRKNGQVPCIMYGESFEKSIPVKMEYPKLIKLFKNNSKGSIIKLKLNDDIKNCVIKQIQRDNVTGKVIHVDFQYVNKNEVIKMKMPVEFKGLKKLQSKKLVLETFLTEVEVQGDVEKIPEYIKIDVSEKDFKDKIFAKDIVLSEEVKLITEPESLLAIIKSNEESKEEESEEE